MLKKIKCHHCEYIWFYGGSCVFMATCPRCYYKVGIKNNQLEITSEDKDTIEKMKEKKKERLIKLNKLKGGE